MLKKSFLVLVLLVSAVLIASPIQAKKKAKKDFFVINGTKYISNPKAIENTGIIGSDQAIIQLKSTSDEVSNAIVFDMSAGDEFSSFKKGTKVNIVNETSEIPDDFDEDFTFPDEAVLLFNHTFLDGSDAVTYSNDDDSVVTGKLTVKSFNKKNGKASFSFTMTISNASVSRVDTNLNQTDSRLTEDIKVTGKFKTVLFD